MRPLCILIAGEPVPATLARRGDFGVLIRDALEMAAGRPWPGGVVDVDLQRADPSRLDLDRFAGLLVTGSASSVTERAEWMLQTEELLRGAVADGVPIFGLCFGHQLLGQALGGLVARNPRGREMGTVALDVTTDDPILGRTGRRVLVNATHVDSIVELPPGASVLASTALDPNAAIRFGERAWGVQFHPEFDRDVMRDYIAARGDVLASEGIDAAQLFAAAAETAESRAMLAHFVDSFARN